MDSSCVVSARDDDKIRSYMTYGPGPGERPSQRTLVIIPTYNERENLPLIVGRVHAARPDVHILIVDDGSPDGTGELANELALADPDRVHVMHRSAKAGLGAAYLAGFAWGLEPRILSARRDGRRRQPSARAAAPAARRRRRGRGPGDRLALRPGRRDVRIGRGGVRCCREPPMVIRGCCSGSRSTTSPPDTAPTGARCWRRSIWPPSTRRATASRST